MKNLYIIKPLEWRKEVVQGYNCYISKTPISTYYIDDIPAGFMLWRTGSREVLKSLEAAKAAAQKDYEGLMMKGLKEVSWIPFAEREPEPGQDVACLTWEGAGSKAAPRKMGGRYHETTVTYDGTVVGDMSTPGHGFLASHWLPLPEPRRKEDEG
jgi:hypothetical protein